MGKAFFCDNCSTQVAPDAPKCPGCGRIFTSVKCPRCSYTGKESEFRKGCPVCQYLAPENTPRGTKPATSDLFFDPDSPIKHHSPGLLSRMSPLTAGLLTLGLLGLLGILVFLVFRI